MQTPDAPPRYEVESDEPAVNRGAPGPVEPADRIWSDEFDALDAGRWHEIATDRIPAHEPPRVTMVAEGAGAHGLALIPHGIAGVEATLSSDRRDALLVSARVRSFARSVPARLLARVRTVANGGDAAPRGVGGGDVGEVMAEIPTTDDFVEVSVPIGATSSRDGRQLQILVVPGDASLALDRIEVRALRPVERVWLIDHGDDADPLPAARLRVCVLSMDAEMAGVFVPVGGAARWRGRVPAHSPRLDLATCVVGGDRGGCVKWAVEVEGRVIARREESVDPGVRQTAFSPWSVSLAAFAGREVAIALRCSGDRAALGFAGAPRLLGEAPADAPPNVVVISLDTLRADRAGPRADGKSLTPRLDEVAARGATFTRACSTSTWTLPAHASLFTGQHPLVHGVVDFGTAIETARSHVLAARFRDAGYATAAFTAGGMVDPEFGFSAGFDLYSVRDPCGMSHESMAKYFSHLPRRPDNEEIGTSTRPAFDWVRRHADGRFFLFLHTYKVHEYDDESATTPERQRVLMMQRAGEGDRAALLELVRRYDRAVREADAELVGGLLDLLDELALRERTLVVVVSDHGEEFCENRRFGHGEAITNELGSIVLVMAGPGVAAAQRIEKLVSLIDVAGTLARLAGIAPDPDWHGVDLFAPTPDDPRAVVLDLRRKPLHAESLWMGSWQVTRTVDDDGGESSVTFCRLDPGTNVAVAVDPPPEQREAMVRRLDHEIALRLRHAQQLPAARSRGMSESLRERLRQLGYLDH